MFTLQTTENNEVSSVNSFAFDTSSARLFRCIRNKGRFNVKPLGTHALAKEEGCLLSTTLYFLFLKNLNNKFKM